MATGEHYFFDVAPRLGLRRRGDGRLGLVGAAPAKRSCRRARLAAGGGERRLGRSAPAGPGVGEPQADAQRALAGAALGGRACGRPWSASTGTPSLGSVAERVGVAGERRACGRVSTELAAAGPAGAAQRHPDRPESRAAASAPGRLTPIGAAAAAGAGSAARPGGAGVWTRPPSSPGCSRTGSRSSRLETVIGGLRVRGPASRAASAGSSSSFTRVAAGEAVALRVELEDDVAAAVAGAQQAAGDEPLFAVGADVEQAGGELGVGAGGGEVGDHGRRAEQGEAGGGHGEAVVGGAGLVGAGGGGAGAAAGDRVEGSCRCRGRPRRGGRSGRRRRRSGSHRARGPASRRL